MSTCPSSPPLYDRVLIKRADPEARSKCGIHIPDSAREKPIEGQVVAIGNGERLDDGTIRKLVVNRGDRVLFTKHAGTEIKIDGIDYTIIREDEVLGVME